MQAVIHAAIRSRLKSLTTIEAASRFRMKMILGIYTVSHGENVKCKVNISGEDYSAMQLSLCSHGQLSVREF